ncbi:MAG TPA: methyltransferase domain-containing protein, partial [Gemmatimonadaceae bacterium]|nr:methyltransferase domain-containing protein [Gemmatimonadaceae bacterium]
QARARLAPWIERGRATVVQGALEGPQMRARFDRVLAINVNIFWTNPAVAFASARRLLAPEGRLLLVFEPPSADKARALAKQMEGLIAANGFVLADKRQARFRTSAGLALIVQPNGS